MRDFGEEEEQQRAADSSDAALFEQSVSEPLYSSAPNVL